ncbi:MAG: DUF456 family protein [Planctomycetota bacterium]
MLETSILVAAVALLLIVNTVGVVLVALQLPGTWLMVAAGGLFAWWRWGEANWSYGWGTLAGLLGLAVLGELLEFLAGAVGSRAAGGSRRGAVLSVVTAVAGAIAGTALIPIPVIGTLVGAAAGAAGGAMLGEVWAGRRWDESLKVGGGAAVGKLTGAVAKLAVAAAMWALGAVTLPF